MERGGAPAEGATEVESTPTVAAPLVRVMVAVLPVTWLYARPVTVCSTWIRSPAAKPRMIVVGTAS